MAHIALNLSPEGQPAEAMQLVVYNPLPFARDAVVAVDLEIPRGCAARAARLEGPAGDVPARQAIADEKSSSFVDSIWEVPRILESNRVRFHARFEKLPGLGYRTYRIVPETVELRDNATLVTGPASLENEHLAATVNGNGTVDLVCKRTGRVYRGLNYLRDQGECGNAWKHVPPTYDQVFNSLGVPATIRVVESGPVVSAIAADFVFKIPVDYADGTRRSADLVDIPVHVEYRLEAGATALKVKVSLENGARDHWLRVCMPTGLQTDVSVADSHFDVVERPIQIPDSTGWVERAFGTHPLRTFASLSDGANGLTLMPRGLYEYEVLDDPARTLALTLIRACRIKLAVSEEKQTELPDEGIQCPGRHVFEYAIAVHAGDWKAAGAINAAAAGYAPARAAQIGRGKGALPLEGGLLSLRSAVVHVSAVKPAEDGAGIVVRLFNPTDKAQPVSIKLHPGLRKARRCGMDETPGKPVAIAAGVLKDRIPPRKIVSYRLEAKA